MMRSTCFGRRALLAALAGLTVALLLLAGCGTSDADRIDEFVKAVSGELSRERIDQALERYVDLQREPLGVSVYGDPRSYAPEQRARLLQDAHGRLSPLLGRRLNVLRKRVDLEGARARVELQLFGGGGMGNVRYVLNKHGDRWLISDASFGP